ncbi:MAG: winged helix-turn-helix transcriptional regulator [Proteobacteria bacterium]|nr:winged helix-turn-helix transcriptional regulator [Pseudomonadota bacterium]
MNDVFKALAHPVRRQILELLKSGPKSAGEIASGVNVSKPTLSGHFAKLKKADLIRADQDGTTIYYTLNVSVLEEAMLKFMATMNIKD